MGFTREQYLQSAQKALMFFAINVALITYHKLNKGAPDGDAAAFDFGLKCASSSANASTCERNVAFTPEFNSAGHCLQGCLSLLLLPSGSARERVGVSTDQIGIR